jgi:hypothetical protein
MIITLPYRSGFQGKIDPTGLVAAVHLTGFSRKGTGAGSVTLKTDLHFLVRLNKAIISFLGYGCLDQSIRAVLAYIVLNHDFCGQSTHYILEERRQLI